ncbi:MAG TPA: YraN family protein [Gemmatimonadales bacterium]|nr:YraN family protein [Gemmatimonadales bacterium]
MSAQRHPKPVSEWSDARHRRGYAGERAAIAHLLTHGWRIEAHRFRVGHHELDLVARRGDLVAFVEVKTRRSRRFGRAVEAVGPRKQAVLTRLAELWRLRFGRAEDRYRFDVIAIEEGISASPQVSHIEGAWRGVGK